MENEVRGVVGMEDEARGVAESWNLRGVVGAGVCARESTNFYKFDTLSMTNR